MERLYAETKELIIPVLRTIPIETSIHRLHLTDVLESGIRFAGESNNKQLSTQVRQLSCLVLCLNIMGMVLTLNDIIDQ